MKLIKYLLLALTLTPLTGIQAAAEEQPAFIQFVRPLAMGGAFTAIADDQNIFAFNPAGMVQRTGAQVTILEIGAGFSQDFKDAYDFVSDKEDQLTNFENLTPQQQASLTNEIANTVSKLDPRVYVVADVASFVSGPRFLGLPLHAGFGAFSVVDANFRLDAGVLVPSVSYAINNDLVFPLSIAHRWDMPGRIPGRLGVGLTGKIIRRNQIKEDRLSVLQLDTIDDPPLVTGTGFGSDLGLLYQPNDRANVGLMVQDFLGTKLSFDSFTAEQGFQSKPARDTVIRPRTNVGAAVVPQKLLWLVDTNDRWTFSADVRDIFVKNQHLFFQDGLRKPLGEDLYTHLHLGTEFRYWFLRLRGGAYQGYPTFGFGVDIPFLKVDYAFYSRELGQQAGDRREENHVVSLALRFGSGATESRERIRKAKESKKMRNTAVPETPMMDTPAEPASPKTTKPEAEPAGPTDTGMPEVPIEEN